MRSAAASYNLESTDRRLATELRRRRAARYSGVLEIELGQDEWELHLREGHPGGVGGELFRGNWAGPILDA
jgi:hypothetical protein